MNIQPASIHPDGLQMHLKIKPGDISRYVLTPGDPGRIPTVGASWDSYEEVAHAREFRTARGTIGGIDISACSHGVGGPSTDIAIVELANCGADTFIRVGSCAALQPEIEPGDLVISTGALRLTGAVDAYVDKSYPAIANHEVVMALIQAADELGERYHVGLAASVDSFYAGQANPMPAGFSQSKMEHIIADLQKARVANFEMEAATIFTLAQLFGLRGGMICSVAANRITGRRVDYADSMKRCCAVASRAVVTLAGWDATKAGSGRKYAFPALLVG